MSGLSSKVDKHELTEEDIKARFITPALNQAGWENNLILMEKYFTAGRILVPSKGKRHARIVELCRKIRLSLGNIYKIIAAMKKTSVIRRIGPTKGGYWEVVE